jgi:hypothetical protein
MYYLQGATHQRPMLLLPQPPRPRPPFDMANLAEEYIVAVCCRLLQYDAICCSLLLSAAVCCCLLQNQHQLFEPNNADPVCCSPVQSVAKSIEVSVAARTSSRRGEALESWAGASR